MKKSKIYLLAMMAMPLLSVAGETQGKTTFMSNPLFVILLVAIILLLALIGVLGTTLKNIAKSDYLAEKVKKMQERANSAKSVGLFIFFGLVSANVFGENTTAVTATRNSWLIGGLDYWTFFTMIFIILCEIGVIAVLFLVMKNLLKEEKMPVAAELAAQAKPKEKTLMDKLNASVEIEHEEEIMLTHNYDGIRELDNDLPPWWKYGFYLTVVVAFVYMIHYHVSKTGDLQTEEFNKEVAKGEAEVAAFLKNSASNVDETNVTLLTAESDLNAAKEIFTSICATCHGKQGEGNSIGPNLTDEYWLHGGSLQDVFKTIKYGWPDKGMQSWKDAYSPVQIAQLASFVKSLKGTNPPNAKEKQGELYIEKAAGDSTSVKADSLKIVAPVDTLKKDIVEKK
jgi:cytochrome c oxidase cbb3-type subunit 3